MCRSIMSEDLLGVGQSGTPGTRSKAWGHVVFPVFNPCIISDVVIDRKEINQTDLLDGEDSGSCRRMY